MDSLMKQKLCSLGRAEESITYLLAQTKTATNIPFG